MDLKLSTQSTTECDDDNCQVLEAEQAKQDIDDFMGSALSQGDTIEMKLRGTYRFNDAITNLNEPST